MLFKNNMFGVYGKLRYPIQFWVVIDGINWLS